MTSAEEFPEETPVPPAVLDSMLPVGSIISVNQTSANEVRIPFTVRDENVDEELEYQASLSVPGQSAQFLCPGKINPRGVPEREQVALIIAPQMLKPGLCTKVDLWVSPSFAGGCKAVPVEPIDSAHAIYWIWETTGQSVSDPDAALALLTSCQTIPQGAPTTSMVP